MINWIIEKIANKVYGRLQDRYDTVFHREITTVKRGEIKKAFGELLVAILSEKGDFEEIPWCSFIEVETLRKEIKDAVLGHCADSLADQEYDRIQNCVNSEDFIDSIVDRINRKQVGK